MLDYHWQTAVGREYVRPDQYNASQDSPKAHQPAEKVEEQESVECDFSQWREE